MPRIWKMLKARGIEPAAERDYPVLSATVHASPWGARFYGRISPQDPDRLYLSLAPVYDSAAAFSAALVLQGTYPRPIQAFLMSCEAAKAPKSQWRSIKARFDALIDGWQDKMDFDSWFREAMADAGERVSRGEEPETVLQDLRNRFDEKYGKGDEAAGNDTPQSCDNPPGLSEKDPGPRSSACLAAQVRRNGGKLPETFLTVNFSSPPTGVGCPPSLPHPPAFHRSVDHHQTAPLPRVLVHRDP